MFELDELAIRPILEAGRRKAKDIDLDALGPGPVALEDLVALLESEVDVEAIRQAAITARGDRSAHLETFAPLYLTNTCDAECKMCGMRRENDELTRVTATPADAFEQLKILSDRGVKAVALLTGEYRRGTREWSVGLTRAVLEKAVELGFRHVLINIGSLETDELERLSAGLERDAAGRVVPKVTMCTFQESYGRDAYHRFMGSSPDNPRADYDRRLANFDRAADVGFRVANPGILVGLNGDLAYEMVALALHARHLLDRGMEVYLSVPRLRKATGAAHTRGVTDDDFVRLVALLALGLPDAKTVITTRESDEIQRRVLPLVTVLSAGSPAVSPYTPEGADFPLEASQFEVIDKRPIEEILRVWTAQGARFENFDDPAGCGSQAI